MIRILSNKDRGTVTDRTPNPKNASHCIICGRPVVDRKWEVWIHKGGGFAVTQQEGEILNATGESNADLGMHPVGSDCLRKHSELKPYAMPALTN
jgi:hypothetical protein